jgi:hypothetical protein
MHAWFERQHSVRGSWCCDEADGFIVSDDDWRMDGERYSVRIGGQWLSIPNSKLRDPAGGPNPTGHAVVWWRDFGTGPTVFCFAPGTML